MTWYFFKSMPSFFWFEVASLLAALICFPALRKSFLKWFVPFLFFIVCVEIAGRYLPRVLHRPNAWLFNFSVPVEYLFYSYIYYCAFVTPGFRLVARMAGFFYFLFCTLVLINYGIAVFRNQLLMTGNLIGIFYSCIYFFEILKKEQVVDLLKEPMFWITCGVFLFNLGELTYTLFRPVLTANRWDVTLSIFKAINNKLIFWLYGCITIGLLCSRLATYRKTSG